MHPVRRRSEPRQQGRPSPSLAVGREAIVDAVRKALETTPPGELTLKQVADIAGVDQKLIRYYFGSLPDLLKVAAIEVARDLRARFAAEDVDAAARPPRERLQSRIGIFLDHFGRNPHYHRLIVDHLVRGNDADSAAAVDRFRQSADEMKRFLGPIAPSGRMSDVDAQMVHVCVAAMCEYRFTAEPIFASLFGCDVGSPAFQDRFGRFISSLVIGSLLSGLLSPDDLRDRDAGERSGV